ncbi:DUF262 domain-containing protein [Nonomuraea sp. NPDC052129]|uniref:DUF262 domain-containing protein n=1 Tax=Nonomuraea sp. NPDC052129 TaxID=3154651 RepID=UPI00344AE755
MAEQNAGMEFNPEVRLVTEMIEAIARGELRIPKFQRAFSWAPGQMLDLFESLERGFPIGSFIVWETESQVECSNEIAGQMIADPEPGRPISYLVDGHQRLATLFGCLRAANPREWKWSVYRVLGQRDGQSHRYRHWKKRDVPINYFPVRSALRTIDFLAYMRELSAAAPEEELADLIDECESVVRRIKDYRVPVVRVVGGSLSVASTVFSRVNTTGRSLTASELADAAKYVTGDSADTSGETNRS